MAGPTLDLGNLLIHLNMNTAQYMASMAMAEKKMLAFSNKMTAVGKQLTLKVTLPLLAIGAAATKVGIDIEEAFIGVRKTVNATEEEFTALRSGFDEMAKRTPIAITELISLGEAAGQLGIETENILGFSETMAQLGVTTNLASQEAATALARLANITQMSQDDFDRLGATIVDLGNNLATTEAEIVTMGLRIAGAGKSVGLTEAQILSFGAAMSSLGLRSEQGGTAFSRVILEMNSAVVSGNKQLELFALIAGESVDTFATLFEKDASEAMIQFIDGLGALNKSGGDISSTLDMLGLGGIRIVDVFNRLSGAGDLLKQSLDLGNEAWADNIALIEEAEKKYASTKSQLVIMINRFKLLAEQIFITLKPAILSVNEALSTMSTFLSSLNEDARRNIILWAGVAAAIGPVLLIMGNLAKALALVSISVSTLAGSFGALTIAMAGPLGIALLLVAVAFTLRAAWVQNFDTIKDRMQRFFDNFQEGFDWLLNSAVSQTVISFAKFWIDTFKFIQTNFRSFVGDLTGTLAGTASFIKTLGEGIRNAIFMSPKKAFEELKRSLDEAKGSFGAAFIDNADAATEKWDEFVKSVKSGTENAKVLLTAFGQAEVEHLGELMDTLKAQFSQDADAVVALIRSKIEALKTSAREVEGEASVAGITKSDIAVVEAGLRDIEEVQKSIASEAEKLRVNQPLLDWGNQATDVALRVNEVFANAFQRMGDELADFLVEGKANFADFAKSILKDLLAIAIRAQVVFPIASALGFAVGSPTASPNQAVPAHIAADGGIFPGGFQAFANGGIATRPTLGLVGEAGMNEAMVPLPDGKNIPVKLSGDGQAAPTIIINNKTGTPFKQQSAPTFDGKNFVISIVADDINENGTLRQLIGGLNNFNG